jgi:hypothetical protein
MVPAPVVKAAPKVTGIHPTGSLIMVEFLTAQEIQGGSILLGNDTEIEGPPQGYVLEVGPSLPESSGIKVGQRVIVQGRGVGPLPDFDGSNKERMLVEFSMIKAILDEAKPCCQGKRAETVEAASHCCSSKVVVG